MIIVFHVSCHTESISFVDLAVGSQPQKLIEIQSAELIRGT
jgi:hypothetical protein